MFLWVSSFWTCSLGLIKLASLKAGLLRALNMQMSIVNSKQVLYPVSLKLI